MLNANCLIVELNDNSAILKIHCKSNRVKKFGHGRIICYCHHCPALKEDLLFTFLFTNVCYISFVSSRACIFYNVLIICLCGLIIPMLLRSLKKHAAEPIIQ